MRRLLISLLCLLSGLAMLAVGLSPSACGRLKKKFDCKEFSVRICDKWFSCRPVIAAEYWVDEEDCRGIIETSCNKPEDIAGCHVDGDDISECNDQLEDSGCALIPAVCTTMVNCIAS